MRKKRLLAILAIGERRRGELADIAQEAQVAVAALQASAQGEGCPDMNTTYTVKHIRKGLFIMCVLCMSGYAEGEIIFNPEGRLKDFYVREWSQVSNQVNRFVKDHNCRKKVLKKKIRMSPYSMIWHEPALTKSEFASVFWNTNAVILVTSAYWTKDECVVKMYDLKSSLRNMIGEIVDSLEKYDYALSVNGDGNTSLFGFVHEDESCVNKCFSIQIGSAYKHAKQKMFCATADSLKAYQYMSKVRDFLKMLMFNSLIESYNVCSPSLVGWREVGSGKLTR